MNAPCEAFSPTANQTDIQAALAYIDSTDRDTWLRMGMAAKDALGEAGLPVWDGWSQSASNYDTKAAQSVWKSIKPGKVTIGTLFYEARQAGWKPSTPYVTPTPAQRAALAAERKAADEAAQAIRAEQHQAAKAKAADLLPRCRDVDAGHPYLIAKGGLKPEGARQLKKSLVLPMKADGELVNLQFIGEDGGKRFLTGGQVIGTSLVLDWRADATTVALCEGWATALSIRAAYPDLPVVVCFTAGNLPVIAARLPDVALIVAGDLDASGTGQAAAQKAAQAHPKATWCIPSFTDEQRQQWAAAGHGKPPSDFNDLHQIAGLDAVRLQLSQVSQPGQADPPASAEADQHGSYHMGNRHDAGDWPEPQPLTVKVEPEPYPLDALPETLRAAVEEVAAFVKAPIPMVVASALGAISLAAQAHIDVKRAERLQGPVGLFLLTIADSGERKSTCDGFFTAAIRDYQAEQAEAAKPLIKDYKANKAAWEAKGSGIKEKIRQLAKDDKPTLALEETLRELERNEPEPPHVPRLLYGDATPEKLSYSLAKEWPSGGVVSAEAGIVFGSHGMGADSVMRNMALLNILWDGGEQIIDRRGSESYTVRGARLTVALQVQELTLRSFFERSGGLARGTGFLARFLVSWPESTQGHRPFSEAPPHWPHLAVFHRRIATILGNPAPIGVDGALSPALLTLTPEAKAAWVEYHDAIEGELISGGELYDVRDVASKTADNATRLAALFQLFEHGMGGAVGLPAFEGASRIAAWHLNESRRFFGELALPKELADATRLDCWLTEHCKGNQTHLVPTREAQRLGPVRDRERLTAALRELEELDRVRVTQEGRRKTIKVNPALAGVTT